MNPKLTELFANFAFSREILNELERIGSFKTFDPETVILREHQYVKVIPIVLHGLIKVSTSVQEKDLLLYYIRPGESCIMSFSAGMENSPSKVTAQTEEKTEAFLVPADQIPRLLRTYPALNLLFFQQYGLRYGELLETINSVLFEKMDKRLIHYLEEKVAVTGRNPLHISHRQIATDLGTAREVVSRVMKKLEEEGIVIQHIQGIEFLKR